MPSNHRIYLDQAATSWPKLPAAVAAAEEFVHACGATAGRGAYSSARVAERWVADARLWLAQLIGSRDSDSIALCSSGTHALNAALVGLLRPGNHVITTAIEHNSVLRPLHHMQQTLGIKLTVVPCDNHGTVDPADIRQVVRSENDVIVVGHASNVTGTVQDLHSIGDIARRTGSLFIVDASQTLGYLPIDVEASGISCLVAAGHKGLRALSGTGFIFLAAHLRANFQPLMWGGTGVSSERVDAIAQWPQSVEVGNLNLPGIVSMAVAARTLCQDAHCSWQTNWREEFQQLVAGLERLKEIRCYGPNLDRAHIPVVSFTVDDWDIHDFAAALDSSFSIEVRAGLHCAAWIHQHLGTLNQGGTVRLSSGHECDPKTISDTLAALSELTAIAP